MAMPPPPAAPPAAPAMDAAPMAGMSQVCVPLETLSMGGDGQDSSKMVPPEVGDPVEFSATGTVARVEGGNAYIDLETVNDQPMPAAEAEPDEMAMRGKAALADEEEQMPA